MMKKLLLAASVALLAMVGCKGGGKAGDSASADSTAVRVPSSTVAYVNIDSLVSKYGLYLDLKAEYETKATKVNNDLTGRGRGLEKEIRDFQDKIQKGLVTRAQAASMEEDLAKKQQSFMQTRDNMMRDIAEEEQVMLNKIHYSIVEFLAEFNSDYRYGMIISTTSGGPILNADPALDITSIVVEGINKKYASQKAVGKQAGEPVK